MCPPYCHVRVGQPISPQSGCSRCSLSCHSQSRSRWQTYLTRARRRPPTHSLCPPPRRPFSAALRPTRLHPSETHIRSTCRPSTQKWRSCPFPFAFLPLDHLQLAIVESHPSSRRKNAFHQGGKRLCIVYHHHGHFQQPLWYGLTELSALFNHWPENRYAQVFVDDIKAPRSCTLAGSKVSRNEVFWFTRGTLTRVSSVSSCLGRQCLLGSRFYGWTESHQGTLAKPSHIEGSLTELAIVHRISADFRLHAHSIVRLQWCVLDVQLIKETLSETVSMSRPWNHHTMNVECGK
jgi:hypothetical protein